MRSVLDSQAKVRFSERVQQHRRRSSYDPPGQRTGLARALSKLGHCSRSEATRLVRSGEVRVNEVQVLDPMFWVQTGRDQIKVNGETLKPGGKTYLMLNKPRGLVTTASDEKGRDTVFSCFDGSKLPFLSPVGRLDRASEGLLLFTNDTVWASRITDPMQHLNKSYHVQVDLIADAGLIQRMTEGVRVDDTHLHAKRVTVLRHGQKNSWLEVVLDEGKNRHIRRLLGALGVEVLRLVRVAIGTLELGDLKKGQWRHLMETEVKALADHQSRNRAARGGPVRR